MKLKKITGLLLAVPALVLSCSKSSNQMEELASSNKNDANPVSKVSSTTSPIIMGTGTEWGHWRVELLPLSGDRFKNNKIKFVNRWQEYLKSHSRKWQWSYPI